MMDNYDRIARFYDVDMARNMRFDDIGFYAQVCAAHPGRVLELGCGTGRILLELLARDVDATGIDASAGMLVELARKAAARGLRAPVAQMDLRRLALDATFSVVLCPYSLVTYLTADDALPRLLAALAPLLAPEGVAVLDAFVPRAVPATNAFTLDYERPLDSGTLARWKRVTPLGVTNRIERRYCVHAADGTLLESTDVAETIRPYTPKAIRDALAMAGYHLEAVVADYAHGGATADGQLFAHGDTTTAAQFFTAVAAGPRSRGRAGQCPPTPAG